MFFKCLIILWDSGKSAQFGLSSLTNIYQDGITQKKCIKPLALGVLTFTALERVSTTPRIN